MNDVRKPPIGAVIRLHKQGVRGLCGWCGETVTETTEVRGWPKFWHDACASEMAIIEKPECARRALLERDHGICCDCGEDWSQMFRLVPYRDRETREPTVCFAQERPSGHWTHGYYVTTRSWEAEGYYPFVELSAVSLWHADHKVPLWKVQHLPPLQRLEYFKLANLVTRCERCHTFKTKKEAAERAKFKAQAKDAKEGAPRQRSRRWGSRPFPKGVKRPWPKKKL